MVTFRLMMGRGSIFSWAIEVLPKREPGSCQVALRKTRFPSMATQVSCPTCDSELLIEGDERVGEEVFCGYCGGVYKVIAKDVETLEVEEDF